MFTKEHAEQNKTMQTAATLILQEWSKDDLYDGVKLRVAARVFAKGFPHIPRYRAEHAFWGMTAKMRGRKRNGLIGATNR